MDKTYQSYDEEIARLETEKALMLRKGYASDDADEVLKAVSYNASVAGKRSKKVEAKAIDTSLKNRYSLQDRDRVQWNKKSLKLSRKMADTVIIAPLIREIKRQVFGYIKWSPNKYTEGFLIEKKTGLFDKQRNAPTKSEMAEIEYLYELVMNSTVGLDWSSGLNNGLSYMDKAIEDSIVTDLLTLESVYTKGMDYVKTVHVDSDTMTLASSYDQVHNVSEQQKHFKYGTYPEWVQKIDGVQSGVFYPHEIIDIIRNPQGGLDTYGYGRSELMISAGLIANYVDIFTSVGSEIKSIQPKGILITDSQNTIAAQDKMLEAMERLANGPDRHGGIIQLDGIEKHTWIPWQKEISEDIYGGMLDRIIRVICSMYGLTPESLNIPMKTSSWQSEASTKEAYAHSKRSLQHFARQTAGVVIKTIVERASQGEYTARLITNIDSREEELARIKDEIKHFKTINEVRQALGLEKIEGGDIILDPNYIRSEMDNIESELQAEEQADADESKAEIQKSIQVDKEIEELFK